MIEVDRLCFSYINKPFAENVSPHVGQGGIFDLLGSSSASRSTIQKVLTGLSTRYKGNVKVAGTEIRKRTNRSYERIGVDSEFSTCYEKFTARENLKYFGSPYDRPLCSTEEPLRMVGLKNDGGKKVSDFLKGMRSRLNFIKALAHNSDILFLDEPTGGLNPTNSRLMKDIILAEKKRGKTIIITTHSTSDAIEPCDQVVLIVPEKASALDTPYNLIMSRGAARIQYVYSENGERTGECMLIQTSDDKRLNGLIRSNSPRSVHDSESTLNGIFVDITGRTLQRD